MWGGVLLAMTYPLVVRSEIAGWGLWIKKGVYVLFAGENYRIGEGGGLSLL